MLLNLNAAQRATYHNPGNTVLISAVIPAYNAEAFVCHAIESALSQSFPVAEVLVVDDGSNDQTAKLAGRYDSRVRVIRKTNGGPASARNIGIGQARGDWIALLDADDLWLPHKLEKQVRVIRPDVALIYSGAVGHRIDFPEQVTFQDLWSKNCIFNSSVLLLRRAFTSVGGFDEDPALIGSEDYNLWLRIVGAGWKVCGIPEELFVYAPPANSLSHQLIGSSGAEIANARKIATIFSLAPDQLFRKELAILDQRGKNLFFIRKLKQARAFFGEALRHRRDIRSAFWWLATWLPVSILNCRRTLLSNTLRRPDRVTSMKSSSHN